MAIFSLKIQNLIQSSEIALEMNPENRRKWSVAIPLCIHLIYFMQRMHKNERNMKGKSVYSETLGYNINNRPLYYW